MGITSQDPEPGREKRCARWNYSPVPNGAKVGGYKAGPAFWCWVHHVGVSKPCRFKMACGALQCMDCNAGYAPVRRGYAPWYSREYQRCFVLLSEDFAELWATVELHEQVTFTRSKAKRSPLVPHRETWTPLALPPCTSRTEPVAILPALLLIWKDAELAEWHRQSSDTAVSLPRKDRSIPAGLPEPEEPTDPMLRAAWRKAAAASTLAARRVRPAEAEPEAFGLPGANGKPKKGG